MWSPGNRSGLPGCLGYIGLNSENTQSTCFSIFTSLYGEGKAYEVTHAIERIMPEPIGVATIEIDERDSLWEVSAYFDAKPDEIAISLIEKLHDLKPFKVSRLPNTDWVAKVNRDLTPVRVGNFWIYMNKDQGKAPSGTIPIEIASSMAFGTGHHGTTQGCLEMLERVCRKNPEFDSIVDIGCGTGILSMAAYRLWGCNILASDNDAVAIEVTIENTKANIMESQIICTVADGFEHSIHKNMSPFDLVIANILLKPLVGLAPEANKHLKDGGAAILSGIMLNQEHHLSRSYEEHDFLVEDRIVLDEWVTLLLRKK